MERDHIVKRVIQDIITINNLTPAERITLAEALQGKREVKLRDGSTHLMEANELERLASRLPSWMKWLLKVPIVIIRDPFGKYKATDQWTEEALKILVGELLEANVSKLIRDYPSLIFIMVTINVEEIAGGKNEGSYDL